MAKDQATPVFPVDTEECIIKGTCPLRAVWRIITNNAGPEYFDAKSFFGGLCLGAGLSVLLTKTVRGICLVLSGGIVTTMVLNHYGFISLNKEAIFNAMNTGYQTLRDKIGQTVESCGSPSQCFHDNILNSGIPRENIISALVGTGVGFTAGLIIF